MVDNPKKRFPLSVAEVVVAMILLSVVFWSIWRFLVEHGLPDEFTGTYALLAVLMFDVAWIVAMNWCPVQYRHLRIYLTLLILTVSGAFVAYVIAGYFLSHMML
jgi:hypothetical protein